MAKTLSEHRREMEDQKKAAQDKHRAHVRKYLAFLGDVPLHDNTEATKKLRVQARTKVLEGSMQLMGLLCDHCQKELAVDHRIICPGCGYTTALNAATDDLEVLAFQQVPILQKLVLLLLAGPAPYIVESRGDRITFDVFPNEGPEPFRYRSLQFHLTEDDSRITLTLRGAPKMAPTGRTVFEEILEEETPEETQNQKVFRQWLTQAR